MPLINHPTGNYQFVPTATAPRIVGAAPFSSAVRAMTGYEIVHVTFHVPLPYHAGFAAAAKHLEAVGRPRTALCAVEVRVPRPLTMEEFSAFNVGYRAVLDDWGVIVDGQIPIARSNVALGFTSSSDSPLSDILLYAFSYTVPTQRRCQPSSSPPRRRRLMCVPVKQRRMRYGKRPPAPCRRCRLA